VKRSTFLAGAFASALLPFAARAQGQAQAPADWPTKPFTFVVPYPPGGVNDAVARYYAEKLSAELGKPIAVDNRVGAATTMASNYVAKAPPDGYTLYGGGTSLVVNPTLTGNVQYDPHKSFEYVSLMAFTPFILHVNAGFPAKTLAELIALAKANPGKFNIASSGIGAMNHLTAELFKAQAGLDLVNVPYKGGIQAAQDVASGQAQMMFSPSIEAKPFLDSGKTRALAISSPNRSPAFPDIPTVNEAAGLKDFDSVFWSGVLVPAGTPQPIVDRLQKAVAKVASDPEMVERFKRQGVEIRSSTQAAFLKHVDEEEKRWVALIKEKGIKAE
jgi:tripartite-type tricarboxylate transporter receptor subunit TctC